MLSRLTPPAAGGITDGVVSLPAHPRVFTSGGGAASPPFSLEGVLKSSEHGGYREAVQPEGLALTLKPYQQQALAWMSDMEALPRSVHRRWR